ncbi:hypothetical protein DFH09DRAFT_1086788 [Mycena vulgaris]|nr:hypothetical protein DFH09DRAFT_1086788 [Mycena vulgaris]
MLIPFAICRLRSVYTDNEIESTSATFLNKQPASIVFLHPNEVVHGHHSAADIIIVSKRGAPAFHTGATHLDTIIFTLAQSSNKKEEYAQAEWRVESTHSWIPPPFTGMLRMPSSPRVWCARRVGEVTLQLNFATSKRRSTVTAGTGAMTRAEVRKTGRRIEGQQPPSNVSDQQTCAPAAFSRIGGDSMRARCGKRAVSYRESRRSCQNDEDGRTRRSSMRNLNGK